MKITIELLAGGNHRSPSKRDIQKNIDAISRFIDKKQLCNDDSSLIDTRSILEAIKKELPEN